MTYPKYSAHRNMMEVMMPGALPGIVSYLDQQGNIHHRLDSSFQKIKPNYPVPAIRTHVDFFPDEVVIWHDSNVKGLDWYHMHVARAWDKGKLEAWTR